MDHLIVDLDKVLDDFEAEESTPGKSQGSVSSDYANFLAKHDDNSWEEVSRAPADSVPAWKIYNKDENISYIDYGEPYEPANNFDLSEADFAPSVKPKSDTSKISSVITNGHDESLNHEQNQYGHKQLQKFSSDSGDLHNTDSLNVNGYDSSVAHLSMHNVNNSKMIDLHGCDNETSNSTTNGFGASGQNFDNTYCKLPIQVVDIFTPVLEEPPQIPITSSYQQISAPNYTYQSNGFDKAKTDEKMDVNLYNSELKHEKSKSAISDISVSTQLFKESKLNRAVNETMEVIHNDLNLKNTNTGSNNSEKRTNELTNSDNKKADEGYDSYDCLSKDRTNDSLQVNKDNTSVTPSLGFSDVVSNEQSLESDTLQNQITDRFDSSEQTDVKTVEDKSVGKTSINEFHGDEVAKSEKGNTEMEASCQISSQMQVVGFGEEVGVNDDDIDEYLRDMETQDNEENTSSDSNTLSLNSDSLNDANSFPPQYSKLGEISDMNQEMSKDDSQRNDLNEVHNNTATINLDSKLKTISAVTMVTDMEKEQVSNNDQINLNVPKSDENSVQSTESNSNVFHAMENAMNIHNMQLPSVEMGGARPKEITHQNNFLTLSVESSDIQDEGKDPSMEDSETKASSTDQTAANSEMDLRMLEENTLIQSDTKKLESYSSDKERHISDITEDTPVMRRINQPATLVEISRPHSWGPSGSDSVPIPQQKRPNSLNLPQRGDFSLSGERSQVPYTFPYPSEDADTAETTTPEPEQEDTIQNEDVQAVGSEQDEEAVGASGYTPDTTSPESLPPTRGQTALGLSAPTWIPDSQAPVCMGCEARFTFTKRRHHCRACGKVFCSACCSIKCRLQYMENKEARVCVECHRQITLAELSSSGSPNPNNPSEYCSVIPPSQQASARSQPPSVLVPASVLKREGSNRQSSEGKHVMFSDGIRPGGDLTELDGSDAAGKLPLRRSGRSQKKIEKGSPDAVHHKVARKLRASEARRHLCLIPETGLPPVMKSTSVKGDFVMEENQEIDKILPQIKDEEAEPVIFALNANLFVLVKIINLDCCVNRTCWCFTTKGMCNVGQDEIVFVLEVMPDEDTIPLDIMRHFYTVYEEAGKGNTVTHMGHTIFNQTFLDSRDHGGMLYIRPTFQCLHKLLLPTPPYVFGILLQKWETPWAKVFPLRLLLRLGAEYRYYPCPLISVRNRKPVFFEIGHTIMNLLADFRNFQYMLPQIKGVYIHMEDKKTVINFPRNRYDDLMKVVSNSNEHVMAMGASFSLLADSHLVCIQNDDGNYQTQAINIQNKPRKVTGASFVVFNGALKSSSGLKAKSSIVEDGLMVQITPESMVALKQALKDMTGYTIECGSLTAANPDEVVSIVWGDDDKNVNIGVKSPIDEMSMDGVESIHIPNATDYVGEKQIIRWTDVFFIQNKDSGTTRWEPVDLSRLAETLSNATCIALTPHLDKLKEASLTKIGLRVNIEIEKVGYDIGSNGEKLPDLYMNDLDNELIPVIHSAASQNRGGAIILELIFHILD